MRRFLITLLCLSPCLAQAQLESTSDLQRGLVGWWRFNEGTGTNAFDLSGNANTGTLSGSTLPVWTNGVFSGALYFATNDVVLSSSTSLNQTQSITMCAWIAETNATTMHVIGGYKDTSPFDGYGFGLNMAGAGKISYWGGNGAGSWVGSSVVIVNDGRWHHIAVTVSGTAVSFFKDGSPSGTASGQQPTTYSGTRAIGARPSLVDAFHGTIDDVRIYSRALSATEVLNLYCQGGGRTP